METGVIRLIDANALPVSKEYCVDEAGWGATFYVVHKDAIDNAPTIDAVEVVRCKDCENSDRIPCGALYCYQWNRNADENGYCHEGWCKNAAD